MHFDQRTQAALREIGLSTEELQQAADLVVAATREAAADIEAFFGDGGTVYSDMNTAHSAGGPREHEVTYCDLWTHSADIRGYLRFESWGVPVEGGRVLSAAVVELTVPDHGRVRFAKDADAL